MENKVDFSKVYITYYPKLLRFAKGYVIMEEDAENITQDVFTDVWEKWGFLMGYIKNMDAYLLTLVRNKCLDHLRFMDKESKYVDHKQPVSDIELELKAESLARLDVYSWEMSEMSILVHSAIKSLPRQCRNIFLMNRLEKMTYREIADQLHLSHNTVKRQMGIALRKLREKLDGCLAA